MEREFKKCATPEKEAILEAHYSHIDVGDSIEKIDDSVSS